jgi:hypothetical protein
MPGKAQLVSLSMCRRAHHGETGGVNTSVLGLLLLLFFGLALLAALLILALGLFHFDFCALFAVARALVVQLVVLGYDFGFAAFAVAAATSTGNMLV